MGFPSKLSITASPFKMQESLSDPVLSAFVPKNKLRANKSCPEHPILHRHIRGVYLSPKSEQELSATRQH